MSYYTVFHLHDHTSNCNGFADSCSKHKEYIKLAKQQNMNALAFSNHGGIYKWIERKQDCDEANIKYIHGIESYLCTSLENNERGYHICLFAKNLNGVNELNSLYSLSTKKGVKEDNTDRHFYFNPRISVSELMNTSDNIIITTACLASIFYKKKDDLIVTELLEWMSLNKHRCFLEIQYHDCAEQIEYNQLLYKWSNDYNIRLIAGTDTHSSNNYKAECRKILQKSKKSYYGQEDEFDFVWKTYDELIYMFKKQNSLPYEIYIKAIHNTNIFADMIEHFELDTSLKYPNLYGCNGLYLWKRFINDKYKEKVSKGIIKSNFHKYIKNIKEEFEAMKKQGMESFMLFMGELVEYCQQNNIPYGFCRGSVGGSTIAYITDITDVDPVIWDTIFSRFCNADRISLADIDIDFAPEDRKKVYKWIINKFTNSKTAYIAQFGTLKDRATIDTLARGLDYTNLDLVMNIKNEYEHIFHDYSKIIMEEVNLEEHENIHGVDFDYHDKYINIIRNDTAITNLNILKNNFELLKNKNKDLFYYFDGLKGTIISKGVHPAGIIGSPITLPDNLGVFYKDGDDNTPVSVCAMKSVDALNFVKFDILGLKCVGILKDVYKYINSHYLKSHEINWNDNNVWNNIITNKVGIFQFEGSDHAFDLLQAFKPQKINDMSLVNAALRPSGKSYRDRLISKQFNKNPSKQIDELLSDNLGYLVYQEDTIKFLTNICGLTGSESDTVRRYIGKKLTKKLNNFLPKILDGYCNISNKPRHIAEKEAKQFIDIIADSSEYQFGYNHSTGYSMNAYASGRARTYHTLEFITAYLNRAENDDDLRDGWGFAKHHHIKICPIRFRFSHNKYTFNKKSNTIYKGLSSVKGFGDKHDLAEQLLQLKNNKYNSFIEVLYDIKNKTSVGFGQIKILIELNYFIEFGDSNKLLKGVEIFEALYKRKQINKKDLSKYNLTTDILNKHSNKITQSLYKEINITNLMIELFNNASYKKSTPVESLISEMQYYGYMQSTYSIDDSYVIVYEINTKYTPIVKTYNLRNGNLNTYKIYRNQFYSNSHYDNPNSLQLINLFDVIKIIKTKSQNKSKLINGSWIETNRLEVVLNKFTIIK